MPTIQQLIRVRRKKIQPRTKSEFIPSHQKNQIQR